jgi:FYVE zinc finger
MSTTRDWQEESLNDWIVNANSRPRQKLVLLTKRRGASDDDDDEYSSSDDVLARLKCMGDDVDDKIIRERNEELVELSADLETLRELGIDLASELNVHGEQLDGVETKVIEADGAIGDGVITLADASELKNKSNVKVVAIVTTVGGALAGSVVGLIVAGPLGAALGATTGAVAVGGSSTALAAAIEHAMKVQLKNTRLDVVHGAYFIESDARTRCQHCQQRFTLSRRRRHCRLCGDLFCQDCLDRQVVNYSRLKLSRHTVVCQPCLSDHRATEAGCRASNQM